MSEKATRSIPPAPLSERNRTSPQEDKQTLDDLRSDQPSPSKAGTPQPQKLQIDPERDVRKVLGRLLTLVDAVFRGEPEQLKAIKDLIRHELGGPIFFPSNEELIAGVSNIPDTIFGQVENPVGTHVTFYGPHPCTECGFDICKAGSEFGETKYDYPETPIYPNTTWRLHNCDHGPRKRYS